MTLKHSTCAMASFALGLALTNSALADVTASDLWENWKQVAATQGQTLTAESVEATSNGIDLSGLTVVESDETGSVTMRLEQVTLANDGAAVRVEISTPQTLFVVLDGPSQDVSMAELTLDGEGLELRVEGTVEAPDYSFEAAAASLELTNLTVGDETMPATAAIALSQVSGALIGWSVAAADIAEGDFSAESLAFELDVTDTSTGVRVQSVAAQKALKAKLEATPPGQANARSKLEVTVGPSEISSAQTSPEQGEAITVVRQDAGRFVLDVADERADYEADITSVDISFANSRLPTGPVSFAVSELGAVFSLPLETKPDPQSATIALLLNEIVFPDEMWAMVDPALAIPRRPARFAVEIDADVLVTDTPPPGLEALADGGANFLPLGFRLRGLAFEFAEAKLDANGEFTLEAAGPESPIPGTLNPVGQLDVMVSGGLALLQQLVAAGLVPAEQAMGAQMMLGMFATPGDGDTLSSTIISEPGGGLVVNGTRLR